MKALSNILMLLFACTVQMAAANWGAHQGDNDVIVSGVVTSAEDGQPLRFPEIRVHGAVGCGCRDLRCDPGDGPDAA